jgi:hypothetical protein
MCFTCWVTHRPALKLGLQAVLACAHSSSCRLSPPHHRWHPPLADARIGHCFPMLLSVLCLYIATCLTAFLLRLLPFIAFYRSPPNGGSATLPAPAGRATPAPPLCCLAPHRPWPKALQGRPPSGRPCFYLSPLCTAHRRHAPLPTPAFSVPASSKPFYCCLTGSGGGQGPFLCAGRCLQLACLLHGRRPGQ